MYDNYYLTKPIKRPKYNLRLLFKAPEDKKKDKKALVIITNPEDTTGAKINSKPLTIPSYKTLVTMQNDINSYIYGNLINNSLEPLTAELFDELIDDLITKLEEKVLAEDVLKEADNDTGNFRAIYDEYYNLINPKLDLNIINEEDTAKAKTKIELAEDFLTYYYKDELRLIQQDKITMDNPKQPLIINYDDLIAFDVDLAELLIYKPEEVINIFNAIIESRFIEEDTKKRFKDVSINARFKNIPNTVEFKNLKSNRIGELVEITGNIKRIETIKPRLLYGLFECNNCVNTIPVKQDIKNNYLQRPNICNECGATKGFNLRLEDSIYTDLQLLTIQEPLENVIINAPREFEVRVTEDLVDKARAGAKVKLTGIFTYKSEKDNNTSYVIEANNIELLEEEAIINITPEDEEKILEFSKRPTVLEDLVSLFAPNLILPYELKLAILCFIVRGMAIGTRREWINLLIIGDPATAKTELKFNIRNLSLKCVTSSGTGATARGLTYSTNKDNAGNWSLEAGVLALADNGNAIIDEFDKLRPEDQQAINEAIDTGYIPVNRAGFNTILPSRAGVICFGNPKGKRFDKYTDLKDQINIEEDVISRYDLTFILKDTVDKDKDSKIFRSLFIPEEDIDNEFLKKYLNYVTTLSPEIAEDKIDLLNEYYLEYRAGNDYEDNTIFTTARQGEALGRISGAIAKLKLNEEVTEEDIGQAIKLVNYSLENLEQLGVEKTKQQKEREILVNLLKENSGLDDGIEKSILRELFIEETNVSSKTFDRRIKELENSKDLKVKGKTVYNLKT